MALVERIIRQLVRAVAILAILEPLSTVIRVLAASGTEESFTINKPVARSQPQQPWVHFSTDHVRCFCNLPVCVTTGYMCKSQEGSCFSDFHEHTSSKVSTVYRGRHGCIELLNEGEQKNQCRRKTAEIDRKALIQENKRPKNLLVCCYRDMCNHVDSPQTKHLLNNTLLSDRIHEEKPNGYSKPIRVPQDMGYTSSEVWFRAATIAVPICGAVILFVLIALALKIMKNERSLVSNNKLRSMYHHVSSPSKLPHEKCNGDLGEVLRFPSPNSSRQQQTPCFVSHGNDDHCQIQVPLLPQNEVNVHRCSLKNKTEEKRNQNQLLESQNHQLDNVEDMSLKCPQVSLDLSVNERFSSN